MKVGGHCLATAFTGLVGLYVLGLSQFAELFRYRLSGCDPSVRQVSRRTDKSHFPDQNGTAGQLPKSVPAHLLSMGGIRDLLSASHSAVICSDRLQLAMLLF